MWIPGLAANKFARAKQNAKLTLILSFHTNAIRQMHRCPVSPQSPTIGAETPVIAADHRRSILRPRRCTSTEDSCQARWMSLFRSTVLSYKLPLPHNISLAAAVRAAVSGKYYLMRAVYGERSHSHLVFSELDLAYGARRTPGTQYLEHLNSLCASRHNKKEKQYL